MSVSLYSDVHVRRPVATGLRRRGQPFDGVIYAHQQNITVRQTIEDMELIAKAATPAELANRVVFLPRK